MMHARRSRGGQDELKAALDAVTFDMKSGIVVRRPSAIYASVVERSAWNTGIGAWAC